MQSSWAGIFPIVIGIALLYRLIIAIANRSKLRRIILHEFEVNPESSIKDVKIATGISRRDVRAIILDLKSSGQFIGQFSTETGQIKYMASQEVQNSLEEKIKYCESCGTPVSEESDQYCSYCGAKL